MSDFVEQCRLEWRRLGVPDALAEEMATDLAADLTEAAAEGVTAEESLEAAPLTRVRSPPPGLPSEASFPRRPAEKAHAADRPSSWRSPPSRRSS